MPALRRQQLRRFLVHLPPDDGGLVGDDGDEGGDGRDEGGDGNGRVGVREGELVAAPRAGEGGEGGGAVRSSREEGGLRGGNG